MSAPASRIPDDVRDRVRASFDIVEVIGRDIPLKRAGAWLRACCPFHDEKTASFKVSATSQRFKCFGCDAGGDVIDWIMRHRGVGYPAAVRALAAEKGIPVDGAALVDPPPAPPVVRTRPAPVRAPVDEVRAMWNAGVPLSDDVKAAEWVRSRGLDPDAVPASVAVALPLGTPCPAWARCGGTWSEAGYRVLLAAYDSAGTIVGLRARSVMPGAEIKTASPAGVSSAGLVYANLDALGMLAGLDAPSKVVVVEGEPDMLAAVAYHDVGGDGTAVLGLFNGSWSDDVAARIPDGAAVHVWTHDDEAGSRYAAEVEASVRGRCKVVRGEFPVRVEGASKSADLADLARDGKRLTLAPDPVDEGPSAEAWPDSSAASAGAVADAQSDARPKRGPAWRTPDEARREATEPDPEDPWVPFPLEHLPGFFSDYARAVGAATTCDPAVPAAALLVCGAASIGNSRWLEVQPGFAVPPALWCGVVADSGAGKSPALTNAWRPMHEVERPHAARFAAAWARYLTEHREWSEATKRKANAGPEPVPPRDTRLIVGDATGEALVAALARCDRGLLVADTELRTVLEGLGAYKNGRGSDEAWLLKSYDGEPIRLARKNLGPVGISAEKPLLSLIGALTPNVAGRVFGGERIESGITGRFLLLSPPASPALLSDTPLDRLAAAPIVDALARLRDETVPLDGNGDPASRLVRIHPGAREVFREAHNALAYDAVAERGGTASVLSKARGLCARFTLIVHQLRVACGDTDDTGRPLDPDVADVESVHRGCALARWSAAETLRVCRSLWGGESLRTEAEIQADALLLWAKRTRSGEPFTKADARKAGPATFRRQGGGLRTDAALAHLERIGAIVADGTGWRVP